ncbi:hypothetical protein FIBSPDRAFT_903565 [Athelia psychrophila]|uniref:Uncharacterized protein n=1 Tax=Athelia psychrophila TaxID=1759441 RepID=A0A167TJX0_9AGAM|nr:hypothetical protein FIBSPDRAFT_905337 [Fibularhizoctonia sp. CBS 109695]KZP05364.1 hypothetical protein FIBSPDRAFT_903565 [Fibularhizoctonia sp. CBS 109695]
MALRGSGSAATSFHIFLLPALFSQLASDARRNFPGTPSGIINAHPSTAGACMMHHPDSPHPSCALLCPTINDYVLVSRNAFRQQQQLTTDLHFTLYGWQLPIFADLSPSCGRWAPGTFAATARTRERGYDLLDVLELVLVVLELSGVVGVIGVLGHGCSGVRRDMRAMASILRVRAHLLVRTRVLLVCIGCSAARRRVGVLWPQCCACARMPSSADDSGAPSSGPDSSQDRQTVSWLDAIIAILLSVTIRTGRVTGMLEDGSVRGAARRRRPRDAIWHAKFELK